MRLEIFTLCDAANEAGGKLNMLGTFDHMFIGSLPAVHPMAALVFRLRLGPQERFHSHRLKIQFLAPSREPFIPELELILEEDRILAETKDLYDSPGINFVINLVNIRLTEIGKHLIEIWAEEKRVGSIQLWVSVIPKGLSPHPKQPGLFGDAPFE